MFTRAFLVPALLISLLALPSAALAQIVEVRHIPPKAGVKSDVGSTRIRVTGSTNKQYDKITTKTLEAWVAVRAPKKPDRDKKKLQGTVYQQGNLLVTANGGFPSASTIYKLTFPYMDPRSQQVANQRVSPIALCNDRLASLSGAARATFIAKGGNIVRKDAYIVRAKQQWEVRKKGSAFHEIKGWEDTADIPVTIECRALGAPKPTDSTSTSDGNKPPTPKRMPSAVKAVSLRGEPAAYQVVNGQSCPTQVRLYGTVEVNRALSGQVNFTGPAFKSSPQNVKFTGKGRRTVRATYTVGWEPPASTTKLALPGAKTVPMQKSVTLRMSLTNAAGKVINTAQTTEALACKPVEKPVKPATRLSN